MKQVMLYRLGAIFYSVTLTLGWTKNSVIHNLQYIIGGIRVNVYVKMSQ